MRKLVKLLAAWLPLAVVSTLIYSALYATVQQVYRTSANDPQVQIARDITAILEAGTRPTDVLGSGSIDVGKSLSPFVEIYDNDGKLVGSTGNLNGQDPFLPDGVLAFTRSHAEDRITWEPHAGDRFAAVITRTADEKPHFVVVARSLKETEVRTERLLKVVAAAELITLVAALIAIAISRWILLRWKRSMPKQLP
ncbi:MAG: hypothetical protein U0514_02600 [Candidatus Andersenbacteria bacterium]